VSERHFRPILGLTAALIVSCVLCAVGWVLMLAVGWYRLLLGGRD
jgi:hypothetical protein